MLLVLDIGNTTIHGGLFQAGALYQAFRFPTPTSHRRLPLMRKLKKVLKGLGTDCETIEGAIFCSVVPALDRVVSDVLSGLCGKRPKQITHTAKSKVKNALAIPAQLGADILVGAHQAVVQVGAPVIVIDMGTATTLTYIDADARLTGGVILPGVITSFADLVSKAAQLESVAFAKPAEVIGKDTATALQSGMYYGTLAQLNGLLEKLWAERGDCPVLLTGGLSAHLANDIVNAEYAPNLILNGLAGLYQAN